MFLSVSRVFYYGWEHTSCIAEAVIWNLKYQVDGVCEGRIAEGMTCGGYSAWSPVFYIFFLNPQRMKAGIHFPDFFGCRNLDVTLVTSVRHTHDQVRQGTPLLFGVNLESLFLHPHTAACL